eukprot:c14592_g1_i1.p1 GENE.c14592_g1_i1~~c14592_g1_i1.p1  ORF type:complete len:364 (-),score=78.33 c14592_g1_i1:62-1153(-)
MADLFSAVQLGAITAKNRILLAPLTRNRASYPGLEPTDLVREYYTQRASAGLIITEATQVGPTAQGYPCTPGLFTDAQTEAWRRVTDSVHAAGGKIVVQLWHCGRVSHSSYLNGRKPMAPSAVPLAGKAMTMSGPQDYEVAEPLTKEEIEQIVRDFGDAARRSLDAGFDGVEIHGANGYLIDQFLRDETNLRTDEYGGSVENRFRFLREVLDAVTAVVPANTVGIRLTPGGSFGEIHDSDNLGHFTYFISELNKYGLAYLHIKESDEQDLRHGGVIIPATTWASVFQGPIIANTNYTKERAIEALNTGKIAAVAFGRLFLANPDLPERLRLDAELNAGDYATFFGGDAKGYTDYPFLSTEAKH